MRILKKRYRAFFLALSCVITVYGSLMVLRDAYRLFGLDFSQLLWLRLPPVTLLWFLFRFFRQHLPFFMLPILIYLPARRYWNHKPVHILMTAGLSALTVISLLQWQLVTNTIILTTFRTWQWCGILAWALLMLITYQILYRKTHSSLYSFLFAVNIAFVMGTLYELPDPKLRMAALTLPYLVSYACLALFLYRFRARPDKKLAIIISLSIFTLIIGWACFYRLPVGSHRFFAYPLGVAITLAIPKQK